MARKPEPTRFGRKAGDHRTLVDDLKDGADYLDLRQQTWDTATGTYPEAELDRLADARIGEIEAERAVFARVAEARRAGASWEQIGAAVGVSRQAAHRRFTESAPA